MNNKLIERMMSKCIKEVVESCAALYSFSAVECMLALEVSKPLKVKASKSIPLPFLREHVNEDGCNGIIFNHGLFTQCKNGRDTETLCNTCSIENCGTLEARMSADFKDPKGRRPSSYISVLRKLKLTQEQAIQEAGKVNIELNESHFLEQVKEQKVKAEKVQKEKIVKEKVIKVKAVKVQKEKIVKEKVIKVKAEKVQKEKVVKVVKEVVAKVKAVKVQKEKVVKEKVVKEKVQKEKAVGRPKSTKKAIETVTVEDLFASLVSAEISDGENEEQMITVTVSDDENEEQMITVTVSEEVVVDKNESKAVAAAVAAAAKVVVKEQKKSEATERNNMHSEDLEAKKLVQIETKLIKTAAVAEAKEQKAAALVIEKEQKAALLVIAKQEKQEKQEKSKPKKQEKAALLVAEKQEKQEKAAALVIIAKQEKEAKALALAEEKEAKALALAEAKEAKEAKAAALVIAKQEKAAALVKEKQEKAAALVIAKQEKSKPKAAIKSVVAVVAQQSVEEPPVKVSVKRMTIDGKEYLKSNTNMLYFAESREEAGIWNPETETIDELPEESDNEEMEDDYDSDEN